MTLNLGYFLIKNFIDKFDIDFVLDIMSKNSHFQFKFKEMVRTLIYAQIIHPASKLKLSEEVIPSIYGLNKFSEDQIYEALRYIGSDYKKFFELFNHEIGRKYLREYNTLYFDCTNYFLK